jgi:hypothetical protein
VEVGGLRSNRKVKVSHLCNLAQSTSVGGQEITKRSALIHQKSVPAISPEQHGRSASGICFGYDAAITAQISA